MGNSMRGGCANWTSWIAGRNKTSWIVGTRRMNRIKRHVISTFR